MTPNKETGSAEKEVKIRIPEENSEDSNKRTKSNIASAHRYFKEYCDSTSIHGMKYLAESRSLGERLIWVALILCSLTACVYLILDTFNKFQKSPVIVSFATKESPIYTIPFPAVTICPVTKAKRSVFNFTDVMNKLKRGENITEQEERYGKYMSRVCESGNNYFEDNEFFTDDFFVAMDEMKLQTYDIFHMCTFMGLLLNCTEEMIPIILDGSVCYTTNILDRTDIFRENVVHFSNYHSIEWKNSTNWNVDRGYEGGIGYPTRAYIAGADSALVIYLRQDFSDIDYQCMKNVQGFNVMLHAPFSMPLLKKQYFNLPFDTSTLAVVKPHVMSTSDQVLRFSPDIRECYFSTEKKLKYFKIYSPRNCKLECFTNYTLKECGCVDYYMPRENGTPICGNAKYDCLKIAGIHLKIQQMVRQMEETEDFYCECKPLCTDITYNVELSTSPWDGRGRKEDDDDDNDNDRYDNDEVHYTKLRVFFQQDSFLTSERNELYGPTDFLANFGGLLGLFTGFSLLSAAEIIYFLTVRMCCNFRLFRKWTGPRSD